MKASSQLGLSLALVLATACGDKTESPPPRTGSAMGSGSAAGSSHTAGSGSAGTGSGSAAIVEYAVPASTRAVGDTRRATVTFKLTGTATVDGQARPVRQTESAQWTDRVVAADGGTISELEVAYASQRVATGDGAESPGPLDGRTYAVTLGAKQAPVAKRIGGKGSATELAEVARTFADDLGVPRQLGGMLVGKTLRRGEATELPAEALTELIGFPGARGKSLTVTLEELTEDSARLQISAAMDLTIGTAEVAANLRGEVRLARADGRVLRLAHTAKLTGAAFAGDLEAEQVFSYGP